MGRFEIEGSTLQAHALNEGITDTMLEGTLRFDSTEEGVAVVLDLRTVGKKTDTTDALCDMVARALRSRSLLVHHDGEEIRAEPPGENLLGRPVAPRKLPHLKKLPFGSPRLMSEPGV